MSKSQKLHPAIHELKEGLSKGKLSRREFLRYATLLGMSAAAASQMSGLMWPRKAFGAGIERGGILKVAGPV
ncbi:MAG: twin-arginine translocation signal domain-containing protein, partial [Pseudomonadota bacterium]